MCEGVLQAWVARHGLKGPIARMVAKAKAVVSRGKMMRAYQAWWKVVRWPLTRCPELLVVSDLYRSIPVGL